MDRFLVNMAVVRVNWDKNRSDILDNYIPFVHESLDNMESDIFSVDDFKEKFIEIAEFKVPTGAIVSLLKRATNKHKLLNQEKGGLYTILRENIKSSNFSLIRDAEQRRYKGLIRKFIDFCKYNHQIDIEQEGAATYFFEVLYDIAPLLFINLNEAEKIKAAHSDKNKFLVSKFVSYSNKNDQDSFEAIVSFVRGSMLTETFYYSQNTTDIENKPLKKIVVYFDTQFLLRILGFSPHELCIPSLELMDMLKEMGVKTRCFRDTLDELHGIFFAALQQLKEYSRLKASKPGDVFDYINQNSISPSDLLLTMSRLEEKLNLKGIYVEERPEIIEAYSLDETLLSEKLSNAFEHQSNRARSHDIACLQAVFQLREGKRQNFLDRCIAIFITTNAQLARLSTLFFNEQYGHSNAAVCMSDHVFTTLVWMKSIKKMSNLSKDRLVANCYSALLPSNSLWADYVKEVNKLKDRGEISEYDYHVLIDSLPAREQLIDQTISSDDNMFGSVEQILDKAKKIYTEELGVKLEEAEKTVQSQSNKINKAIKKISYLVNKAVLVLTIALWIVLLGYGLINTTPDSLSEFRKINIKSLIFSALLVITVLNLIFGFKLIDYCKSLADICSKKVENKIKTIIDKI